MDNQYMKSSVPEVKFLYENKVMERKDSGVTIWKITSSAFMWLYKLLVECVKFTGAVVDTTVNALSKLISIKIGILDTSKVELCQEISKLNDELASVRLQNKKLDAENYILHNAVTELEVGGNMCYDKVVQWFGNDSEPAVRWRSALLKANSSRGFIFDEASEYHEVRKNQTWLEEYEAKKKDGERKVRPSSKGKRKTK